MNCFLCHVHVNLHHFSYRVRHSVPILFSARALLVGAFIIRRQLVEMNLSPNYENPGFEILRVDIFWVFVVVSFLFCSYKCFSKDLKDFLLLFASKSDRWAPLKANKNSPTSSIELEHPSRPSLEVACFFCIFLF